MVFPAHACIEAKRWQRNGNVAIKKTELPSTGIYQRPITSAEVSGDPESLKDLQDLLEQTPSRDVILASLEEIQDQAETFLRLYLIQELGESKQIPESDCRAVRVPESPMWSGGA